MAVDIRSESLVLVLVCIGSCTYVSNPNAALDGAGDGEMPDGVYCNDVPIAAIGADYAYQPELVMAEPADVEWGAMNLPLGLAIDAITGMVSGTPLEQGSGEHVITIVAASSGPEAATYEADCGLTLNPRLSALSIRDFSHHCLDYQSTYQEFLDALEGGDATDITCSLNTGGAETCPLGDGDGRLAPGVDFDASTCTHSGTVNSTRYGTWVWMVDIEQSGYTTTVPFCATNDIATFHDIVLTANGVNGDPLEPALYVYDPDQDLGFGNGSYHWDINDPACPGNDCNNFGFRFDVTCSPFDVTAPWSVSLSPSSGGSLGLSHEMNATGPAPNVAYGGPTFAYRPFVSSFEMSYCTSADGNFCFPGDETFEQNAQTKYHFDVIGYPIE